MTLKTCPPPEMLSAYFDRELRPAEYSDLAAHLLQCAQCSEVLSGLRSVDAALRDMPVPPLFRPRKSPVSTPTRRLHRAAVILLVLALILTVAAGCAFGARLLGVFRTEHHVVTQPGAQFPPDVEQGIFSREAVGADLSGDVRAITEVETLLKAHLLEPAFLPDGYKMIQRSAPFESLAELVYLKSENESINIRESNHQRFKTVEEPPVPASAAESVDVGGHRGIYVKGGWYQGRPSEVPVWREDIDQSVTFEVGDLVIEVHASLEVSKEDLLRIASSMH